MRVAQALWRSVVGGSAVVVLNGCLDTQSEAVGLCEFLLKDQLKSPSSYEAAEITDSVESREGTVRIEFDASNSYGAQMRGSAECLVVPGDGDELDVIDMAVNGEDVDSMAVELGVMDYYKGN